MATKANNSSCSYLLKPVAEASEKINEIAQQKIVLDAHSALEKNSNGSISSPMTVNF